MQRHYNMLMLIVTMICFSFGSVYLYSQDVTDATASESTNISQETTSPKFYNTFNKVDLSPKLKLFLLDEENYSRYKEYLDNPPPKSETDTNSTIISRKDAKKDNHKSSSDSTVLANILYGVSHFFVNTVLESIFKPDEPIKTYQDENDEWYDRFNDGQQYDPIQRQQQQMNEEPRR